jgi:hypothetical protein
MEIRHTTAANQEKGIEEPKPERNRLRVYINNEVQNMYTDKS